MNRRESIPLSEIRELSPQDRTDFFKLARILKKCSNDSEKICKKNGFLDPTDEHLDLILQSQREMRRAVPDDISEQVNQLLLGLNAIYCNRLCENFNQRI